MVLGGPPTGGKKKEHDSGRLRSRRPPCMSVDSLHGFPYMDSLYRAANLRGLGGKFEGFNVKFEGIYAYFLSLCAENHQTQI